MDICQDWKGCNQENSLIHIEYVPWSLRGCPLPVWQLYVEIKGSKTLSSLIEVRNLINSTVVRGIVIIENKSKAIRRLGWDEMDSGVYYRRFE